MEGSYFAISIWASGVVRLPAFAGPRLEAKHADSATAKDDDVPDPNQPRLRSVTARSAQSVEGPEAVA